MHSYPSGRGRLVVYFEMLFKYLDEELPQRRLRAQYNAPSVSARCVDSTRNPMIHCLMGLCVWSPHRVPVRASAARGPEPLAVACNAGSDLSAPMPFSFCSVCNQLGSGRGYVVGARLHDEHKEVGHGRSSLLRCGGRDRGGE